MAILPSSTTCAPPPKKPRKPRDEFSRRSVNTVFSKARLHGKYEGALRYLSEARSMLLYRGEKPELQHSIDTLMHKLKAILLEEMSDPRGYRRPRVLNHATKTQYTYAAVEALMTKEEHKETVHKVMLLGWQFHNGYWRRDKVEFKTVPKYTHYATRAKNVVEAFVRSTKELPKCAAFEALVNPSILPEQGD